MEIEDLAELTTVLADPDRSLSGVCLQDLDLTAAPDIVDRLANADPSGLVLLGGNYPAPLLRSLIAGGATVLPSAPGLPFDPYRSRLYRADELYDGLDRGYPATLDARCYHWSSPPHAATDIAAATFAAIHDASVTDALHELLAGDTRPVVAVMGGHGLARSDPGYLAAADLGRRLAGSGALVATGGGPGAMEAVNLGAAFAYRSPAELTAAVRRLATIDTFADITDWAGIALRVAADLTEETPGTGVVSSIGVPTWFYGHEPPNVFAGAIAKYFSNAIREDVLLATAGGGLLVLPGAAGTVQEIFQAATRGYYATEPPPPIVLIDTAHWETALPAWPLLRALGSTGPLAGRIAVCRSADEAIDRLEQLRAS